MNAPFPLGPGETVAITIGELPRGSCTYTDRHTEVSGYLVSGESYTVPARVAAMLEHHGIPIHRQVDIVNPVADIGAGSYPPPDLGENLGDLE